jgi:hypothetical protein
MINEYPDYLNEEYRSMILNVSNPNHSGGSTITNDFQLRQTFAEKMSQYMNIQEARSGNMTVDCITNITIGDSYIVYSQ